MALVASWEVLTVDDVGEAEPGVRRVDVAAVASSGDKLVLVRTEMAMTPRVLEGFRERLAEDGRL